MTYFETLTEKVARFNEVLAQWQSAVDAKHRGTGAAWDHVSDKVHFHIGDKYARFDIRDSGAFMVEIMTGTVYGIKGYGKVNKAKNSGNIYDPGFNGSVLLRDRFRYGNFTNTPDGTPVAAVR